VHIDYQRRFFMSSNKELIKAINTAAQLEGDRKYLSCAQAFALAKKFEATIGEVGDICNTEEIKLKECQLGCF
jgi:hypothetical protein